MINSQEKKKSKDNNKEISYKTNLYQKDTNYSIKLSIVESKLQILIKASKNFSEDIYEYSNTYSFKQLQITNKYFSRFQNIEEVCSDLDNLLKLKVSVEEDKDKSLIIKIPTLNEKSTGDIIFKLIRTKKIKKIKHSADKLKGKNKSNNKNIYETNIKGVNDNNKNNELLLGNINELVKRVKNLEKKEVEKEKKINKLKEDISNYQEKINSSINYPVYSPLVNKNMDLADDKNNNISQIIKHRNEEEDDDDDVDMNLDMEKNDTIKEKKKKKEEKKII